MASKEQTSGPGEVTGSSAEVEAPFDPRGLLPQVIAHSPSPVAIFDRQMRYLAASASWYRSVGHPPEALGQCLYDLLPDFPPRFREMHQRCLAGQIEEADDDRFTRPDALVIDVAWRCEPWRTAHGDIGGLIIQGADLTSLREAEAGRRRAEQALDAARLKGLESRINEIELVVQLDGTIVHVNDRAIAAYGYRRDELEGMDIRRIRQADPPEVVGRQMATANQEGIRFDAVHVRKDGSRFAVEVSSRAFVANGERYLHSLVRDLTEQHRAERELREARELAEDSARKLDALLQSANVGICQIVDRRQVWANRRMEVLLGYPVGEIVGRTTEMYYPSREAYETLGKEAYSVLATGRPYFTEQELVRKDGGHVWVRYSGQAIDPSDMSKGTLWVLEDVTEARAERKRRAEAEDRLARVLDGSMEGFFDLDLATGVSRRSDRVARMLGRDPLEIPPNLDGFIGLLHPDDRAPFQAAVEAVLRGKSDTVERDVRARHADGAWRWLRVRARLTGEAGGEGRHYSGTITDVTEIRRAQDALAESEERLRSIVTAMAEGVILQDEQGRIVSTNPAAERILGLTRDQMEGRTSVDPRWRAVHGNGSPFPGEDHPATVTLRTGKSQRGVLMGVDAPGAGRRWLSISSEPLLRTPDAAPYAVVATFADVTELRHGQEELAASEARYRGLFENLREEVTVFEVARGPDGRVVDWILRASNAQARRFFGGEDAYRRALGRRLTEILGEAEARPFIERSESILVGESPAREVFLAATARHYQASSFSLDTGTIITAAVDVTDRKRAEQELKDSLTANKRLVAELQETLAQVKTLKGLLPICMYCHQIRDDSGYWSRLESYFAQHSEVLFSHALCPACAKKHFPDVDVE